MRMVHGTSYRSKSSSGWQSTTPVRPSVAASGAGSCSTAYTCWPPTGKKNRCSSTIAPSVVVLLMCSGRLARAAISPPAQQAATSRRITLGERPRASAPGRKACGGSRRVEPPRRQQADDMAIGVAVARPALQQPALGPLRLEVVEVLADPELALGSVIEVDAAVDIRTVAALVQLEHEIDVVPLAAHVPLVEPQPQVRPKHEARPADRRLDDRALGAAR